MGARYSSFDEGSSAPDDNYEKTAFQQGNYATVRSPGLPLWNYLQLNAGSDASSGPRTCRP